MKKIILYTIVILAATVSACGNSNSGKTGSTDSVASAFDTTKLAKGETYYQCPMDPEAISNKPGVCPKCKMDLQEVHKK